jgi:hypothetical protein
VHINERLFKFTYIINTALAKLYFWQTMWTDILSACQKIKIPLIPELQNTDAERL